MYFQYEFKMLLEIFALNFFNEKYGNFFWLFNLLTS